MTSWAIIFLAMFIVSLMLNLFLWYRWHSYRGKPAGGHSHTGMMPRVDRENHGG